jgi:DNA-binding LacI/PurR family transcriptional regulator
MAEKAPTIRDVASRAGVSVATASNVVNGNRPVAEASRHRVAEAIAALGYRLDRSASALRGKSTRLVSMVVHSKRLENIELRIAGARSALAEAGLKGRARHLR